MVYRVLIIGCGAIAGGYDADRSAEDWPLSHAGAIARDARFELAGCVDPDDEARGAFGRRWNVPLAAPSIEALEAEPGAFDLIVIASPTRFHADHLNAALDLHARAVFCEKPLASDPEEAGAIAARCSDAGVHLAVNYTRRWAPDLAEFARQIEAGWWGEMVAATGTYTKGIVHNGSHLVDLLQMMIGPLELHGIGPARLDHWEDDPTVSAMLVADNCAPVHLIAGDARAVTQFELVLSFEKGEIAMRDGGMRIETRAVADSATFAGYRQLGPPESVPGRYPEAMARAYADLAETLDTGAPLASTADTALAAQRLCEDIRRRALEKLKKDSK
jgi:predicted dehydrogenase